MPSEFTPAQNLASLKNNISKGSGGYATIKPQYTGSWNDDIQALSKLVGVQPSKLLSLNPWLSSNNFVADSHGYTVIKLSEETASSSSSSGSTNNTPSGYYATNSWVFPLGVGTWYCSQEYKSTHTAIDLTTGVAGRIAGSPIYASKAGTCVEIRNENDGTHGGGWGNAILIRHDETKDDSGNCYYTRYAHMISLPTQKVGDKISQGDKLGAVGNTGTSTGYHLHYQIYWTSATRTDYGNFTGHAAFSVNPNNISDFPGIPWKENKSSQVNYTKSPYITNKDMDIIIGATKGDGSVSQKQFDDTVNSIADKVCQGSNIKSDSNTWSIVHEFINQQLSGLKEQGEEAVYQLISGGNFYYIFDTFCQNVVNNAVWYIQYKVGETLVTAGDAFVTQTKTGLKQWVFEATNLEPNSDTASALGTYLDSYVDAIIQQGWSAVTTAISTSDVQTACDVFLQNTKRDSIDFMCNVTAHGAATAISSYIPTIVNDDETAQIATDLSIGIINVTVQSVGGVLKGDISIAQAAKNILSQAVISITSAVVTTYVMPYITNVISDFLTQSLVKGLTDLGITIGTEAGGLIGAAVGAIVGFLIGQLVNFLMQKLVGFFTQ